MKQDSKCLIETKYGQLIPNYSGTDVRKKYREAVSYYKTGNIESIYLEEPQIVCTPIGDMMAELLTFYPDGTIKRLFPLYGQISGYWTEEDEFALAKKTELSLLGQVFCVHPLCISFYPSGKVKSLTIWRKDTISVQTKYGEVKSNFGFELTENGTLKSIEPAFGTVLTTEYGRLYPFNSDNYHLHAENNSLVFNGEGELLAATTIKSRIRVVSESGERYIGAQKGEDPLTGTPRLYPLSLTFHKDGLWVEYKNKSLEKFAKDAVALI